MNDADKKLLEEEIEYVEKRLKLLKKMRNLPEGAFIIGVGNSGEGVSGYELPDGRRVYV